MKENINEENTKLESNKYNGKEEKVRKKNKKLIYSLIFSAIFVYILFVFIIPFNGGTIYEWRNLARYKNAVTNKKYQKLQVYALCLERYLVIDCSTENQFKFKLESLGANSYDVCLILEKYGVFSKNHFKNIRDYSKSDENMVPKAKLDEAIKYVRENMTEHEYIACGLTFGMKRKWHHYFLI